MMVNELDKYCVRDSATMLDAIASIQSNNSRCVVVLNDHSTVIGMFSEGDVLRAVLAGVDVHTPVRSLVKPSFRHLRSRDLDAARKFIVGGLTLIPVITDDHHLQSVITIKDIFGDQDL
jgi:CBS domain-containing protein